MLNERRSAIKNEAVRLEKILISAGALHIEADTLLSAEILLDLYGEDIRARAYVTQDPVLGERMLRPDFTVPIVQRHMSEGAEPARYCYNGSVWRKQEPGSNKASEFIQVGFELFDKTNPAKADSEIFSLFSSILPSNIKVVTGDIGILCAAINGLTTSDIRRSALRRHLWRPARFLQILDRFSGKKPIIKARQRMLRNVEKIGTADILNVAGKHIGLRSEAEILGRINRLIKDALEPVLLPNEVNIISKILTLKTTVINALRIMQGFIVDIPNLRNAVNTFERRIGELDKAGIDIENLLFEGRYGLTNMEYYDGFVFSFTYGDKVVASGGRYDSLTTVLGNGHGIAAVGGVIRPDILLECI